MNFPVASLKKVNVRVGRMVILVLAYMLTTGGVLLFAAAPAARPATAPATQKGGFTPAFDAMAYVEASCARCHGPHGSFHEAEVADMPDDQLITMIKRMSEGQAGAPLDDDSRATVVAFHRSLGKETPYVSVTALEGEKISGEVTSDSTVSLDISGKAVTAKVDGSNWSAVFPAGTKSENITITADHNGKKTTLSLAKSPAYSHSVAPPATEPAK